MSLIKSNDGLNYSYRYAIMYRDKQGKWRLGNTHYLKEAIYEIYKKELQYAETLYTGMACVEYIDGNWVVDADWLQKQWDGNSHQLVW